MELAGLFREYLPAFEARFGSRIGPDHRRAIAAILRCRTSDAGELVAQCPECGTVMYCPHSCGHRSCPKCQHHETGAWLDRQREKLLPIPYYLVTFTVPAPLRSVARSHPKEFYDALFQASAVALQKLGENPRFLGGQIAMTGVLHTNNRRLGFHPHIHYLVPGGAIDKKNRLWNRKDWNFLFPEKALARIFRAKLLAQFRRSGWDIPDNVTVGDWVVNCKQAGSGEPALKYLSCYLYRGIIAESRIVRNLNGKVTFRYRDGKTKAWRERTLPGEDFVWLIVQHVLPSRFRRARDYGYHHGNAWRTLRLIQLLLHAPVPMREIKPRPAFRCPDCSTPMVVIAVMLRQGARTTGPP
jgi:ribosomal protein L37AE/L43A